MSKRTGFDFNLLRALEVFVAIVETRNITRAARMLGMTQSGASQHLHALERRFATALVDRHARPIELTRAGIVLHRRAERILGEAEDLHAEMRRIESAPVALLRVGMLASIATTLTSEIMHFAHANGIPEVSCFAGLASEHHDLLRNRRADLVITSDALYEASGLERQFIMSEAYLLVTPAGYRGPKDDLVALARHLPLVRFANSTPVGRRTDQHLRRLRLDLPRGLEADRASMVTAAVHEGGGFAILTPSLLIDAVKEGMRLAIDPLPVVGFRREITAVYRPRELADVPARLATLLAARLRDAVSELGPVCLQSVEFDRPATAVAQELAE